MKSLRLSALAAALVLGACSSPAPTDPTRLNAGAKFDEGPGMMGSGHVTSQTEDGGNMIGSGNGVGTVGSGGGTSSGGGPTTTSDTGGTTTTNDTTTQRGGGSLGSGN